MIFLQKMSQLLCHQQKCQGSPHHLFPSGPLVSHWVWRMGQCNQTAKIYINSNCTPSYLKVKVAQLLSLTVTPWTIQFMEFSRPEYWSGQPFPSPGDLPNPEMEPRSPTLQVDSLPAEPQGKPKNAGVGNLSLLGGIFPTQESNQGLLHYR